MLFTSEFMEVALEVYKPCCSPAAAVWPTDGPGGDGMGCKLLAVGDLYIYVLSYA